jgi:hypothetical protein
VLCIVLGGDGAREECPDRKVVLGRSSAKVRFFGVTGALSLSLSAISNRDRGDDGRLSSSK